MSSKDTNNSGLLSKMVKFVKQPDHQLDRPGPAGIRNRESSYSASRCSRR